MEETMSKTFEDYEACEVEAAVSYIRKCAKFSKKPECPNHAKELTYEAFSSAADAIIEPFSKVINRYYEK